MLSGLVAEGNQLRRHLRAQPHIGQRVKTFHFFDFCVLFHCTLLLEVLPILSEVESVTLTVLWSGFFWDRVRREGLQPLCDALGRLKQLKQLTIKYKDGRELGQDIVSDFHSSVTHSETGFCAGIEWILRLTLA